ncbi:MAG: hypothetical protein KF855_18130 [Acidobacteria bacterium]|nr:hypothetical protein [Acidobacteriota bacterium]
MQTVDGIEIEKNANGQDAFIRIDLSRYSEQLRPFLEEIGMIEEDFEEEWKNGLTLEEARERTIERIRKRWNK